MRLLLVTAVAAESAAVLDGLRASRPDHSRPDGPVPPGAGFLGPYPSTPATSGAGACTVVTAGVVQGGEGLYITDNRTGHLAVFTWDPASRTIKLRASRAVADAFAR